MATVDEPLSLDAQQLYQSIADADVTATTMFLGSSHPALATLRVYQGDIATAAAELSTLRAAGGQNRTASAALATLSGGLPLYTGYVAEARSAYALGYPLTGGSFVQVASEEAHLDLLPAATTVFDQENDVLAAASGMSDQAADRDRRAGARDRHRRAAVPGAAMADRAHQPSAQPRPRAGVAAARHQRQLAAGRLPGRAARTLEAGIGHGSQPAQQLAQASIDVQRIRGDAVLNVNSRSGDASFQSDFTTTSDQVGPGDVSPGHPSLLSSAAAAENSGTQAAALVGDAEHDATTWYAENANVYTLGGKANYAGERSAVIAPGAGSSAVGYGRARGSTSPGRSATTSPPSGPPSAPDLGCSTRLSRS